MLNLYIIVGHQWSPAWSLMKILPMGDDAVARGFQGIWWTCCWCHLVRIEICAIFIHFRHIFAETGIKSIAASPPNAGPEHSWRSTGEHTVQIWYIYIIVYLSGYELCMYRHTHNIHIYIYICEQSRITFFGDVTSMSHGAMSGFAAVRIVWENLKHLGWICWIPKSKLESKQA